MEPLALEVALTSSAMSRLPKNREGVMYCSGRGGVHTDKASLEFIHLWALPVGTQRFHPDTGFSWRPWSRAVVRTRGGPLLRVVCLQIQGDYRDRHVCHGVICSFCPSLLLRAQGASPGSGPEPWLRISVEPELSQFTSIRNLPLSLRWHCWTLPLPETQHNGTSEMCLSWLLVAIWRR